MCDCNVCHTVPGRTVPAWKRRLLNARTGLFQALLWPLAAALWLLMFAALFIHAAAAAGRRRK